MAKILVIDDERAIRNTLKEILEFEGYHVEVAENGRIGLDRALEGAYDLIFTDIKMPEMDGLEFLRSYREGIAQHGEEAPVVVITGHGSVDSAVDALKGGAFDFIQKPLDLNRLLVTTKHALDHKLLVQETKVLRKKVGKRNQMIGESAAIERVRAIIDKVAPTEARVLITGSNGTGKEVVAHLIYENSNRSKGPLVEVNCAAIPSELIESELFGHMKGSFTGAVKDRAGKFEQADGGTLFLDEIGDMSLSAQTKVLRALQENEITRVGSDKAIKVNVRVLAATNKDLKQMVANGEFRQDLYYRINTFELHLPALRERTDEILPLAEMFVEKFAEKYRRSVSGISADAAELLKGHSWSGNIRELSNCIEKAVILSENESLTSADLEIVPARAAGSIEVSSTDTLEETEEKAIRAAMARFGGNLSMVAKSLSISRPTLYAKLKKYNI